MHPHIALFLSVNRRSSPPDIRASLRPTLNFTLAGGICAKIEGFTISATHQIEETVNVPSGQGLVEHPFESGFRLRNPDQIGEYISEGRGFCEHDSVAAFAFGAIEGGVGSLQ